MSRVVYPGGGTPPPYFFAQSLQVSGVRGGLCVIRGWFFAGLQIEKSSLAYFGFALAVAFELGVIHFIELFEEALSGAFGFVVAELGGWGEDAVLGIVGDFGDGLFEFRFGIDFGQVAACDLEAVEEQAGAARIDFVGGDAAEDFADGKLDGAAVFRIGDGEARLTTFARAGVLDGAARVVVVVAEVFGAFGAAEDRAAAATAVGEDVTALVDGFVGVVGEVFESHGGLSGLRS